MGFRAIPSSVTHRRVSGSLPLSCFFANSFHFESIGFSGCGDDDDVEFLAEPSNSLTFEGKQGLLGNIANL